MSLKTKAQGEKDKKREILGRNLGICKNVNEQKESLRDRALLVDAKRNQFQIL